MSGTLSLNEDDMTASGEAIFTVANRYEKSALKNEADLVLHVEDLKFDAIPYSDINKTLGNLLKSVEKK
jgi:hypothetical protein